VNDGRHPSPSLLEQLRPYADHVRQYRGVCVSEI